MNSQDYLNQIAADTRALSAKKTPFGLSPTVLKLIIGAAILAVIIIIVGSIFGKKSDPDNSEQMLVTRINMRADALTKTVQTYNRKIKSSELRSIASSFSALLVEVKSQTDSMLKEAYDKKALTKENNETLRTEEGEHINNLETMLEESRLNGYLDRTYVREITNQAALMINLEGDTINKTDNENVKSWFEGSREKFITLHEQISNFHDSTN